MVRLDAIDKDRIRRDVSRPQRQDRLILGRVIPAPSLRERGELDDHQIPRPRPLTNLGHTAVYDEPPRERIECALDPLQVFEDFWMGSNFFQMSKCVRGHAPSLHTTID